MGWLYLLIAIGFEVAGTSMMKLSEGLTRLLPTLSVFGLWALAIVFLTLSLKTIDIGIAYAIWAGLGTVVIVAIGIFAFNESAGLLKLLFVAMIIVGAVGLKLTSSD